MGSSTTTQQSTPQPTATESQLMSNELQYSNATNPGNIANALQAQGFQSQIMQGVGGNLAGLMQGISPGQSQNEAQLGNQGIAAQYQQMGGLDSGSAAQSMAGNYANTLNSNAQYNTNNLLQLMNLASGNAAQNVAGVSSNNGMLGSQSGALAGTSSSSTVFANPFQEMLGLGQSALGAAGAASTGGTIASGFGFCWVASELFDGWSDIRTVQTRFYLMFHAPKWFRNMYAKFGENFAKFIHNKPMIKNMIRPLFEIFASKGKEKLNGRSR